jgi:RNA polymerase sigma-54 factor
MKPQSLQLEQRQHPTLSPRLQHAVRLLQLTSQDFAQEVQAALGRNPFLELGEPPADGSNGADDADALHATSAPLADALEPTLPGAAADVAGGAWITPGRVREGRFDTDAMEQLSAEVGLRAHLHQQVNLLPLTPRDHTLAASIIESLDDDGYLRLDPAELAAWVELEPPVEEAEIATALKLVQSLEPSGVAARSLSECLLLQLPAIADADERALARRIITEHLARLAQHDVASLAQRLKCAPALADAACERIRRLDPHPGWRFGASEARYVTPDIIVRKVRDRWLTALNPAVVPRVRINELYAELFQQHRSASHAALAAHLQEARWTVRNVEQRFSTILAVSQAIVERQHHFLEYGPLAMNPLGLREIAQAVGLHESTVSRATSNKYMATPAGIFELKYFFSRAMSTASGGACSATAIRGVIKEMIAAERPAEPLSDVEIARQLARQGLVVARRTVTKYRQMLKLAAAERRRRPG